MFGCRGHGKFNFDAQALNEKSARVISIENPVFTGVAGCNLGGTRIDLLAAQRVEALGAWRMRAGGWV